MGQEALERGEYSLSVKYLHQASQRVSSQTLLGGEVRIWLVTAYQAAQMDNEAIALCRELLTHPHPDIRQQSKNLLYIIEAPRLNRPKEWMSEIPDLTPLAESSPEFNRNRGSVKPGKTAPEAIESPSNSNQDNQFIVVSLLLLVITLGSLFWIYR
ncbi:hypothetical protein [Gloeocapsa sp. PCC 73106]|uniref:hypothetical protein n=1 Tax=Gloeocapsa sp. PCC 73106 TaxID=102232 RepID=UPI0008FBEE4D|nr:hypothetical protein [Gloeocapsa sp. PCC 73106]